MKLNGNYVIHTRIGGAAFSEVIDGQPCVIASFDNGETAQALLGVITSAVAQQRGRPAGRLAFRRRSRRVHRRLARPVGGRLMNENEVAHLIAKTLQWVVKQAESPSLAQVAYEGDNKFSLIAVPGRVFEITVKELV